MKDTGYVHDPERIYMLRKEDDIPIKQVVAYLPDMKDNEKTAAVLDGFRAITSEQE